MLSIKTVLLSFCLFFNIAPSVSQNCKTSGEWCADTYQCCGGCCIRSVCIDISASEECISLEDPCLTQYCPADSVCRLYKPSCAGCEIQRECVFEKDTSHNNIRPLKHIRHKSDLSSEGQITKCSYYLIYCFFILYFI